MSIKTKVKYEESADLLMRKLRSCQDFWVDYEDFERSAHSDYVFHKCPELKAAYENFKIQKKSAELYFDSVFNSIYRKLLEQSELEEII
jgi:hypothetical protein